MKPLVWALRMVCVSIGIVVVTLDTGPDLGRRALFLGMALGLVNWLFDIRNLGWVDRMVSLIGLVQFRRIFAVTVLVLLGAGAVLVLKQDVEDRVAALLVFMCATLVSGLCLTSIMVFFRLKKLERDARMQ